MLSAQRDTGRAMARNNDVVDEAGKRRDAANQEGGYRTPVGRKTWGVTINAVEVVHVRYGDATPAHDIVAAAFFSGSGRDERGDQLTRS